MLILPPGHYEETSKRAAAPRKRRMDRRERAFLVVGCGLVALLVIGVVIAFTSVQKKSANGCIDVSAATVIGGSELYKCGAAARALCEAPADVKHSYNVAFERALIDACRKAGLPVPHVSS
jgi:hypothetical protein